MKLAVFLPNWIGDVVMATPALRALRQHFADAEIVGVHKPYVAGLLAGAPWLDRSLPLDRKGPWGHRWPAVAARLRSERIDMAVLFPNTLRSALAAWLGGCGQRIGYRRYGRSLLLTTALNPLRDARGRLVPAPVVDAYNALAAAAGCPQPSHRLELFTTREDEAAADALWKSAGFEADAEVICLNPGAAFGSSKYWPVESFSTLAQLLIERRNCRILVLCGPGERQLARNIARLANRPEVHTLAEAPLSLGLSKACVRRAQLLVTTDSGPRHFAAAFDRPVVTLFGPTHIEWTETWHPKAVHLQKQVPCGPCQLRTCPLDHRCMTELTPVEVANTVQALLDRLAQSVPVYSLPVAG